MWPLLRAGCLLGLLAVPPAVAAQTLRLVADAWPPFTDATMINGGLATDIVTHALVRAGYAAQFEQVPWARAVQGIGEGRYDVLVNAWFSTERTEVGQFSDAYLVNQVRLLRRKGADVPDYTGQLKTLQGVDIAVVRGYAYTPAFDADPLIQKVPVHSFSMAVRMLAADRVKLTLEDEYVARYYLMQESPRVRGSVEFFGQPLAENALHILVSLKNPEHARIVADFDRAIASMKADGSYARLLSQYGM
jgi:polar amino acid transport system substrate-binding protein